MEILVAVMLGLGFAFAGSVDSEEEADAENDPTYKAFGPGDDRAQMGSGDDHVEAGAGNDQITGGGGNDRLLLGPGNDQSFLTDATGPDLRPASFVGDDTIWGGAGDDLLLDPQGANTLYGGAGHDLLNATDDSGQANMPDFLDGGPGDDTLMGDNGDILRGGAGIDRFGLLIDATPEAPAEILDYTPGERIVLSVPLLFDASDADLTPEGDSLELRIGGATVLVLRGITDPDNVLLDVIAADMADHTINGAELVFGSNGDDILTTGAGDDAVFAARGDDLIGTGAGDDMISLRTARPFETEGPLGWGNNIVDAGAGADQVLGGLGDDLIRGGGGNDLLLGGGGLDTIHGGTGADRIDALDRAPGGADRVFGGAGDDTISADNGDIVTAGAGRDTIQVQDLTAGDAVVTLTDYDPTRDILEISVPKGALDISYRPTDTGTRLFVDENAVFDLTGIRPEQMRDALIRVSIYR